MNRRDLMKGMVATAAGILIPGERKVWALDRTMVYPEGDLVSVRTGLVAVVPDEWVGFYPISEGTVLRHKDELMWVGPRGFIHREQARTLHSGPIDLSLIEVVGHTGGSPRVR